MTEHLSLCRMLSALTFSSCSVTSALYTSSLVCVLAVMGRFARTQTSQSQGRPVSLSRSELSHLTLSDSSFRRKEQQLTNEEVSKVIYYLKPQ